MSEEKTGMNYRDAGVNIDAAYNALKRVKDGVRRTFNDNVLEDIGSFGAMFKLPTAGMEEPILVSSVDGVGTKLKLAFMTGKHDTVGIDLVCHCVNDILVQGAQPLFFLDYLAVGKMDEDVVVDVITGLTTGCRYSGCALIGGETAEMPGLYTEDEYDLAGMIVGMVDRNNVVDGKKIKEGDVIIGLPSSGLHTNGYSLARKICFDAAGLDVHDEMPGVGRSVADALMAPHLSYAKLMRIVMAVVQVHGMAHITGGGITDNFPRILPEGLSAEIQLGAWTVPPVFRFLKEAGEVADLEMLRTFNLGQGFLVVVPAEQAEKCVQTVEQTGNHATVMGRVIPGEGSVVYEGTLNYG